MSIDAFEMVLVHRMFRRELGNAAELVGSVAVGDTKRSGLVATHLGHMVWALHHHHAAEDDLLWPKLYARVALRDNDIERMEKQHEAIAESVEKVQSLLTAWAKSPEPVRTAALKAAAILLAARVDEHLDDEERTVVPLINEHITAQEWTEANQRTAAFLPKINVKMALAFLGLVLQDATPDERRRFLADIPAPPRVLLKLFGQRTFDSYRTALYGSAGAA